MSGIPRQPAEIAKSKGLFRPSRHGSDKGKLELEHLSSVPEPPANLSEVGIAFWNDMLKQLLEIKGLVTIPDLPAFQIMAYNYQTIMECSGILEKEGKWMIDDKGNTKEHPALVTMNKAEKIYLNIAASFGCTPSARNNIKVDKEKENQDQLPEISI